MASETGRAVSWTPERLVQTVKKGEFQTLYYLYGDETFLIDESLSSLVKAALGDGLKDFNFNTYYGSEAEAGIVRDAIETLPMMTPKRVVVLKDAQDLSDKEWDLLMPVLDQPVDSTVFICVATKIDKRKKYSKKFLDAGAVIEFKRPFENQISDWVRSIAQKHGLLLSVDAIDLLQQLVGANLQDINSEMTKLAQYVGQKAKEKKQVTADDVLAVVSHVKLDSVFDLADAIGSDDRARALSCLVNLMDNGQNAVGILALVSRHVRILKLVNDGLKEGLSGQRLSSRAGVAPFFLKSYVNQSASWSERKIERTFQALLDTDRALKSSSVAPHIWLENFVLQTCS
jgi:DNA polymerase-3 subunit delta